MIEGIRGVQTVNLHEIIDVFQIIDSFKYSKSAHVLRIPKPCNMIEK